jgi:hypothetical protein
MNIEVVPPFIFQLTGEGSNLFVTSFHESPRVEFGLLLILERQQLYDQQNRI